MESNLGRIGSSLRACSRVRTTRAPILIPSSNPPFSKRTHFTNGGRLRTKDSSEFARHFPRAGKVARIEGNGGNARMPAATVFLRQRGEVLVRGGLIPRICAQRDFGAHRRRTHAHRIGA